MESRFKELFDYYKKLEEQFPIMDVSKKYSGLVTANGNHRIPIQRWFHLKEAFSLELLESLINDWNIPKDSIQRILDPFCGIGTTLLASQSLAKNYRIADLEAIGIERNPFLQFVAQTKCQWHNYDPQKLGLEIKNLLNERIEFAPKTLPALSTLHRTEVYDFEVLNQALYIKDLIQSCEYPERAPLLVGFASILESISGVRKDGRALRIMPNKQRLDPKIALNSAFNTIMEDLYIADQYFDPINSQVLLGDGRTLKIDSDIPCYLKDFDLIFYSPPYLNNIDYTEVYKMELWMCDFIESKSDFQKLRHKTFRSHPSIRFRNPIMIDNDNSMNKVIDAISILIKSLPKDKNFAIRSKFFKEYFDDMYISLKHQIDALTDGGWIFCIIGNSLHGPHNAPQERVTIASDLIIALIGKELGLEIKAIQVARHLTRRIPSNNYLRESIIAMKKL